MEEKTIEQKVADAILERATDTLTIEGYEYKVAPPTLGTLIMVSELASHLPAVNEDADNMLHEILRIAGKSKVIGKIAAVLILGAKRVEEGHRVAVPPKKRSYFSRILRRTQDNSANEQTIAEVDFLAQIVLNNVSPSVLKNIVERRLIDMELGDFFALTTSLKGASVTRKTREVETASGD